MLQPERRKQREAKTVLGIVPSAEKEKADGLFIVSTEEVDGEGEDFVLTIHCLVIIGKGVEIFRAISLSSGMDGHQKVLHIHLV